MAIERELEARGWLGLPAGAGAGASTGRCCEERAPGRVHRRDRARLRAAGGGMLDVDTVASPGSWEAALHSAGGAVRAVEALLGGRGATSRSAALRPPGPPRGARAGDGLLPVQQRRRRGARTRSTITAPSGCWCSTGTSITATARTTSSTGRDEVLYASIHQSPLYPGTGPLTDNGTGAGEGYTVNLPVPPGTGHDEWLSLVQHVVAPIARAYEPRLVDRVRRLRRAPRRPARACELTEETYAAMTASMRDAVRPSWTRRCCSCSRAATTSVRWPRSSRRPSRRAGACGASRPRAGPAERSLARCGREPLRAVLADAGCSLGASEGRRVVDTRRPCPPQRLPSV